MKYSLIKVTNDGDFVECYKIGIRNDKIFFEDINEREMVESILKDNGIFVSGKFYPIENAEAFLKAFVDRYQGTRLFVMAV